VEFEADAFEPLGAALAGRIGFELASHTLELFGRCAACRTLGAAAAGEWGHA
jgi:Fe2+ or Zn2+ uptake regulation protein